MLAVVSIGCAGSGGAEKSSSQTKVTKVFAFTSGQYTNMMSGFEVDKTTGALTPTAQGTLASTQALPMISAALANKKFILTVNYSSNSISCWSVNGATGELALVAHTDLGAGTAPSWVVTHPTKPVAYVAQAGTDDIAVLDVDEATGAVTVRGTVAAGDGVTALELNAAGDVLYSVDQSANEIGIYAVDAAGDLAKQGSASVPAGSLPNQAKLRPQGDYLYVADWNTGAVSSFAVSGTTLTAVETLDAGGGGVYTVAISPDGDRLYVSKPYQNELVPYAIDPADGKLTAGAAESVTGMVNMSFWGDFAFLVAWANSPSQPIQTRAYTAAGGLGASALSSTAIQRGLYQLLVLEIEQEE